MKAFYIDGSYSHAPFPYFIKKAKKIDEDDLEIILDDESLEQLEDDVGFPVGHITATQNGDDAWIVVYATGAAAVSFGARESVKILKVCGIVN